VGASIRGHDRTPELVLTGTFFKRSLFGSSACTRRRIGHAGGMERTPPEIAVSLTGRLDTDMREIEGRCELGLLNTECTKENRELYRAMLRAAQEFRLRLVELIAIAHR
jgi:hypothetical protein